MPYLLESSGGNESIEICHGRLGVVIKIKSKFYSKTSGPMDVEASFDLPTTQKEVLKNIRDSLCAVRDDILQNNSKAIKFVLFKDMFFMEMVADGSLIQEIDKRWYVLSLNAPPEVKVNFAIKLDVTVIDRFLGDCSPIIEALD